MNKTIIFVFVYFLIQSPLLWGNEIQETGPKRLKRFCPDCVEPDKVKYYAAIGALEKELQDGLRLLSDSYRTYGLAYTKGFTEGQQEIIKREREVLSAMVLLWPKDVGIRYRYSETLKGKSRISELEQILMVEPCHANALFDLGMLNINIMNNYKIGSDYLKRSVLCDPGLEKDVQDVLSSFH